jgi:hypothetical protein
MDQLGGMRSRILWEAPGQASELAHLTIHAGAPPHVRLDPTYRPGVRPKI